jgi:hypothetical protein
LVPFARSSCSDRGGFVGRPSATFLAHLIATAQQAPQTRQRRRAEPDSACAHYTAANDAASEPASVCWM